ncbi:protein kinase domain-containing protein [Spirillospora sp. CA-253888]
MLNVPLKPSFRYVHEPLDGDGDALPPLGDPDLPDRLGDRIRHSRGGTFLITGFRGVGKTTLVRRTLRRIAERSAPGEIVVPVMLSVARSTTTERLLFAVVRRIFETLNDTGTLDRLTPQTRQALLLAYMRTSLSFKETRSDARERGATLDLGAGSGQGAKALVEAIVPKAGMSAKRTRSLATEASFLAYSETDVEHDLIRIVTLLRQEAHRTPRRRWWRRPAPVRLRPVVVLDEVDKLTVDDAGRAAVEELLAGVKNVLTMSGAHFIMVAGPDLHDRALHDAARGNGVYESAFGWHLYVPCSWDAPDLLVRDLLEGDASGTEFADFVRYLSFKARGVPRRLLQEFNRFVRWEGDRAWLSVGDGDADRIAFYARLEGVLQDYFEQGAQRRPMAVPIDEDRWRLGGYHAMDRVLRSEGEPFSAVELLREDQEDGFDPSLRMSRRTMDRLLDHLVAAGVLVVVREPSETRTIISDVPEAQAKVYRLAADMRRDLYGLAERHETERRLLEPHGPAGVLDGGARRPDGEPVGRLVGDRYRLRHPLGAGGMSEVWEGEDTGLRRPVAVKLLRGAHADSPEMLAMARREAEIALSLRHPAIVRSTDFVDAPGAPPALVMELLDGAPLRDLLSETGTGLPPDQTAAIAHRLAAALDYLAERRIVNIDMKPGNIVMRGPDDPVVIDFGLAERLEDEPVFPRGGIVGTPMFMAPELLNGDDPTPRSDLYSFGLVLYNCLHGAPPRSGRSMYEMIQKALTGPPDLSVLPASTEFRAALAPLLATDPDDRYESAADFVPALEATPEWRSLGAEGGALDRSWRDAVTYRFPRQARAEHPS